MCGSSSSGKKSLYVRLGCRGDWPNLKPPGWDPEKPEEVRLRYHGHVKACGVELVQPVDVFPKNRGKSWWTSSSHTYVLRNFLWTQWSTFLYMHKRVSRWILRLKMQEMVHKCICAKRASFTTDSLSECQSLWLGRMCCVFRCRRKHCKHNNECCHAATTSESLWKIHRSFGLYMFTLGWLYKLSWCSLKSNIEALKCNIEEHARIRQLWMVFALGNVLWARQLACPNMFSLLTALNHDSRCPYMWFRTSFRENWWNQHRPFFSTH